MSTPPLRYDLLNPDAEELIPVSPRYATVRRITGTVTYSFLIIGAIVCVVLGTQTNYFDYASSLITRLSWVVLGVTLAVWVWNMWLIGRQVSAHRYLEDDEDLIVARGRWWRSITVVPYGRIQFVDLTEGPILRLFGLARLKLNTASVTSDAEIVGIPRHEAQAIRERLSQRARERMAGL